MTSVAIFGLSGLAIILLMITKWLQEEKHKNVTILNAISKGNVQIRKLHHLLVYFYDVGKAQVLFIFKIQIPLHSKNIFNKLVTFLKKQKERYVMSMRDSKLLKKHDGLSEFFQNMSSVKKGDGEINDVYENDPADRPHK
jgi:hypothetical protein